MPYPNPVSGNRGVKVDLAFPCSMSLRVKVFSVSYRKVLDVTMPVAGRKSWTWDLRDGKGKPVAGGLYYLVFEADGKDAKTRRLIVLR